MKYAIACRNGNDPIAGLFVNTDPYGFCRESEFQAIKTELAVKENKITINKINSLGFANGQQLVAYIKSLKGAEASSFTRKNGLQTIIPTNWFSKNVEVMEDIQRGFITQGGARGREYLITLIALYKENLGIIESSSTDDRWGIKAPSVSDAGSGENKLGKIHMKLAKNFSEKFDSNKLTEYGITKDEIDTKRLEIQKLVNNGKLNIMRINGNNVKPASNEYTNERDDGSYNIVNPANFLKTALIVGFSITAALNIPFLAPTIALITGYLGQYPLLSSLGSTIAPFTHIVGKTAATSLAFGTIAGTIEQTIEVATNFVKGNRWADIVKNKVDNSLGR